MRSFYNRAGFARDQPWGLIDNTDSACQMGRLPVRPSGDHCRNPRRLPRLGDQTVTNPGQVPPDTNSMRSHAARLGERELFYPERRLATLEKRGGIDAFWLAPLWPSLVTGTAFTSVASGTRS